MNKTNNEYLQDMAGDYDKKTNNELLAIIAQNGVGGGSGGVTSVNGQTGDVSIDKSDVGLSNVNNTSDANKPISTATQEALNDKVDKVLTPHQVYGTDANGDQSMRTVATGANPGSVVLRDQNGRMKATTAVDADDVTPKAQMDAAIQAGLESVGFINGSTMPLDYEFTSKTISILPGDNGQVLGTVNDAVTGMTVTWVDTPKAEFVDPSTGTMADVINALIDAGLMSSE